MTRVFTHNATHALTYDDAAIFTTRADRRTDFHSYAAREGVALEGAVGAEGVGVALRGYPAGSSGRKR